MASAPMVGHLAAASEMPYYPAGNLNTPVVFMLLKKALQIMLSNRTLVSLYTL